MHPAIEIPGTNLRWPSHDVMVALAALVAVALTVYWTSRNDSLSAARVSVAIVLVALSTAAGGRLHFVFANWEHLAAPLASTFRASSGSLHAPGAILGATIGLMAVPVLVGLPALRLADALAPAAGVGIAIARIGCFLHGCCYGEPCALPWAVSLSDQSYVYAVHLERGILPPGAARSLPVHPLPLYFSAAGIAITGALLWLRRRKRYDGELAICFLFLFGASSAILEPLRIDDLSRVYWGPLPQVLWISASLALVSGVITTVAWFRSRDGRSEAK